MARTKRKVNALQSAPAKAEPERRIYNTAGYIRLSVEDSGKPGADTIEMQKEMILSYIGIQSDMKLCGMFCDNGKTGTDFERPAFEQLMSQVKAGKIDCIVVKDLSRFGRNYLEADNYIERIFPFMGTRFVSINDHFDTLTAEKTTNGLIVSLKNIINSAYSKDISKKSSSALATKMKNGEFIGSWAPYGYRKCADDHHKLEPDEETAPVVQMIFQWRSSGVGLLQIARMLNEQDIPSPSRYHYLKGEVKAERFDIAIWHPATVKVILSSEAYLGHMVQGRCHSSKMVRTPKSEWIIVRNTHQPLVDEETFRKVQELSEKCRSTYNERKGRYDDLGTTPHILKGLVFCADCKQPMLRYKNVSARCGNRYYTYICRTHSENLAACTRKNMHEIKLIEILWEMIQHEISLAVDMEKLARQYKRSQKAASRESFLKQELSDARRSLDRAKMLHDSLYQNYVDKLMSEREYMEMKRQYKADIERAAERLETVERQYKDEKCQTEHNVWMNAFKRFSGETELTEEMAHALIDRVEVDAENNVSITLRYRDEYRELSRLLEESGVMGRE